jgi:hypothetical protein
MIRIVLALMITVSLAACGSRLNPMNWFKGGKETVALYPKDGFPEDADNREAVSQVVELVIERASGGAIIRAAGLPPRPGYWNGELVAENEEYPIDGALVYIFRISQPGSLSATEAPAAQKVIVGHFVSDIRLQGVREIKVLGAENAMSARR